MKKVLFLSLTTFSGVGGIERFNKSFVKAVDTDTSLDFTVFSLNDVESDDRYLNKGDFMGFNGNKVRFSLRAVSRAFRSNILILGHINLSLIACLALILNPSIKIVIITHGIEVWRPLSYFQKKVLKYAAKVVSVSKYTRDRLIDLHSLSPNKIEILPNTIDPYFNIPFTFEKDDKLLEKYGINTNDNIIITVARVKSTEKEKGYDKVILSLPAVLKTMPNTKYLLVGKYDSEEYKRLESLARSANVLENVIFTGYVSDEELAGLYLCSDTFVMPSKKEGFGIVFIEAMLHGVKVIGGNKDGAVDALQDGELGILIDPDNISQLESVLIDSLGETINDFQKRERQGKVIESFGFESFRKRIKEKLLSV